MKKFIKDPLIIYVIGVSGFTFANLSENSYVNSIIVPMFLLIQIIGVVLMVKKYLIEKKVVEQEGKNTTDSSYIKPDISIWMSILAAFGSLFAVVASLVLLLLLHKGDLDIIRYFIIATSCIHVVIVVISFVTLFKILANKKTSR